MWNFKIPLFAFLGAKTHLKCCALVIFTTILYASKILYNMYFFKGSQEYSAQRFVMKSQKQKQTVYSALTEPTL